MIQTILSLFFNPRVRVISIVFGSFLLILLAAATWQDKIRRSDKGVYKAWVVLKEGYVRRTEILPQYAQVVLYYAPQAQGLLQSLGQVYQVAVNTIPSEKMLSSREELERFSRIQKEIHQVLMDMDRQVSVYPTLAQNHHYFMLKNQLLEIDGNIVFAEKMLEKQIHVYNSYIDGFPKKWLNYALFGYQSKFPCLTLES